MLQILSYQVLLFQTEDSDIFVYQVIMRHVKDPNTVYYFLLHGWLASDIGDGRLWREIKAKKTLAKEITSGMLLKESQLFLCLTLICLFSIFTHLLGTINCDMFLHFVWSLIFLIISNLSCLFCLVISNLILSYKSPTNFHTKFILAQRGN